MYSSIRCQNVQKTDSSGSEPSVRSAGNQQNPQEGVVEGLIPLILDPKVQNGLPASSTASSQMTQLMLLRGNHTFVDQKSCIDDVVHVDSITIYRCSWVLLPHSEDPRWDSGQNTHLELMSGIKSGFMLMAFGFPGIILSYVRRRLTKTWFSCKEKQKVFGA